MKLKTFFKIYFRHRINKANLFLKLYLYLNVLIRYLLNLNYFEKKINFDKIDNTHDYLFHKDINYLFEYFNSDKGQTFIDQYPEPFKRRKNKNKILCSCSIIYEKYFKSYKNKNKYFRTRFILWKYFAAMFILKYKYLWCRHKPRHV